jgi:hypothetical protein
MQGIERLALLSPLFLLAACQSDWGPSPGGFGGGGTPYEGATPELLVDQPTDQLVLGLTQDLAVSGRVTDADDVIEDLQFELRSSLQGDLPFDVSIVGENAFAATVALDVGTHELTFAVQDSRENRDEVVVTVVKLDDQPPSDPTVGIAPQEPVSGQALFLAVVTDSIDPEGQHVSYTASWEVDGEHLVDYDGDWEIPRGVVEVGQTWKATVVASDGALSSNPATAEVTVDGSGPAIEVDISPEAPTQQDELTCTWDVYDPDGDEITSIEATWYVQGVEMGDGASPLSGVFTTGDTVACEVTAVSSQENSANAQVVIANAPPVVETVTLSGAPAREADTLACSATGSDLDGDALNFTYTWYVDGVATLLGDELDGEYFDKDQEVFCSAVADDGSDSSAPLDSETTTILNTPPTDPAVAVSPATPLAGSLVSCEATTPATDPDPADTLVETWTWTADGSTWGSEQVLNSYGLSGGDELTCTLRVSDGEDAGEASDTVTLGERLDGAYDSSDADFTLKGNTEKGYFGHTVLGLDDLDGDGTPEVAVSGYGYESNAGGVFVFSGADITGNLDDSDAAFAFYGSAAGDELGGVQGIAPAGDVDGDGLADLLAGASKAGDSEHGAVYLLLSDESAGWTWGQDIATAASVVVSGSTSKDRLGEGLHASDLDGDGVVDLALGAPYEDTAASAAGAVGIFYGPVSGSISWTDADARITGDSDSDRLGGNCIRSIGDVDGDGTADLLVGAQKMDGGDTDSGVAFVLDPTSLTSGTAASQATLRIEGEDEDDDFGISGLGLGDLDGDGADEFLVGARFADVRVADAGGVYFFYGDASMTGTLSASSSDAALGSSAADDRLGWDMDARDMDGDGMLEWTTGAYTDTLSGSASAGRSYLVLTTGYDTWGWGDNLTSINQARFDGNKSNMLSGRANALVEDLDGDGYGEWAVSAEGRDRGSKKRAGFVYILSGP